MGVALTERWFDDAAYTRTAALNFNSLVAENECKWQAIQGAGAGEFNFGPCDRLLEFAEANDMEFRFHTLAWFNYAPAWVEQLSTSERQEVFTNHVRTVVDRYCGRVAAWDVVNEALKEDGSMRTGHVWEDFDYIDVAFRTARETCPNAKLFYNDYNIASSQGWSSAKSNGAYRLAQDLQSKGLIDGVGLQSHHSLDYNMMNGVRANMARIGALGLEVQVTELDIACGSFPGYNCGNWDAAKQQKQADLYKDALNACLEEPACTSFTMWGYTDRYTWLTDHHGSEQYPLIFEESVVNGTYAPKPAFFALVEELEENKD